ncbi:Endonuclease 4 [Posidoniimonas corsicana]|uniref:Probable endonuclease 4 n=2 Tax=Posidoniimonas corsicana TaxID=1938618 RepID=A0A5C5VC18_9BACT|nr:Endonuclease 4 [Posidoniimonas corsicana]
MSIAGGYYKSVDAAAAAGCDCVQLFTKNNNQWRAKPITDDDVERFRGALKQRKIRQPISHASYLINLASPDDELWKKSIDAMAVELQRAEQLGIPFVVVHPGSFTTSSEEAGLKRIAKGLNEVHKQTSGVEARCLLENTAGQGSNLGHRFEHLATIIDLARHPDRLGVCIDTCHAFAAGYPMETEKEWKATVKELNQTVGLASVHALHLNDSKKPLGSRVDRHEHIGRGEMGLSPFRHLMNDRRFARKPMYLETAKGEENGEDLDVINLRTLRGLIEK